MYKRKIVGKIPENKIPKSGIPRNGKVCHRCGVLKFMDSFRWQKDGTRVRNCNACRSVVVKRWNRAHPEKAKIANRQYARKHYIPKSETAKKLGGHIIPKFKQCPICDTRRDPIDFRLTSRSPDGLSEICKICAERWGTLKYYNEFQAGSKICSDCGVEKSTAMFRKSPYSPDGFASRCKECRKLVSPEQLQKELSLRNRLASKDRRDKYMSNPDNAERERIRSKKRHIEKRMNKYGVEYDPGAPPIMVGDVLAKGMWCYLCEKDIDSVFEVHCDHVIPLTRGGRHHIDNLRPTHDSCNVSKNDKTPEEYWAWLRETEEFAADPVY